MTNTKEQQTNMGGDALREELKNAIMELTDEQLEYVLRRIKDINEEI